MPVWDQQLPGDRGDQELHQLQIRQVHQGRHEGIAADTVSDADVDDFKLVWRYLEASMLVLILKNNLQAEFLRGKRKISEDEEAEDLSGIRGSLEENPGSNSNSSSSNSQATGKRRPSESSVYNNTSPTHPAANTLSQPPVKSPNSFSRMRSPTTGFPNNPPVDPTSPVPRGASSYGLSPNYGHPPSILSPPGINPGLVEVKSLKIAHH